MRSHSPSSAVRPQRRAIRVTAEAFAIYKQTIAKHPPETCALLGGRLDDPFRITDLRFCPPQRRVRGGYDVSATHLNIDADYMNFVIDQEWRPNGRDAAALRCDHRGGCALADRGPIVMLQLFRRKDSMKDALRHIQKRLEELAAKYDDQKIAQAWVQLAKDNPIEHVTTAKGVAMTVRREVAGHNKVAYRAFLEGQKGKLAWLHCNAPTYGRVQVTNANVYEVRGKDYRRHGIGTAIYDVIERDVRAAGGAGVEPHWGSMSDEAIAFWKKRRPDEANNIETLNKLGPGLATGLFD